MVHGILDPEYGCYYDSQPIPSSSLSNPCLSSPITLKLLYGISLQSKSGGYGVMQTFGYDGSQESLAVCVDCDFVLLNYTIL